MGIVKQAVVLGKTVNLDKTEKTVRSIKCRHVQAQNIAKYNFPITNLNSHPKK